MLNIKIEDLRPAMVYLNKERGMGKKKIAELFGVVNNTVIEAVRRYEEQGNTTDRQRSGRPVTATTEAHQTEMEAMLAESPIAGPTRQGSWQRRCPSLADPCSAC